MGMPDPRPRGYARGGKSALFGVADRERGLEVVPRVGPERDVGRGLGDAGNPVQVARDDVGKLVMRADPDHGHEVELTGHRVDLGYFRYLRDRLGRLRNARDISLDQNDSCDHCRLLGPSGAGAVARSVPPAKLPASDQAVTSASVCTPSPASRASRACSTSAVALASSRARCRGSVPAPKKLASVASLQSGTSASPSTDRASAAVSRTGKSGQAMRLAPHAVVRKPTSKGALCAVSTQPLANAMKPGSTAPIGSAWLTIASVMPVSATMSAGIGWPGLTSAENSARGWPPPIRTAAISVTPASAGSHPVVSTSTITKPVRSSSATTGVVGSGMVT